jgi:hypothetical protein
MKYVLDIGYPDDADVEPRMYGGESVASGVGNLNDGFGLLRTEEIHFTTKEARDFAAKGLIETLEEKVGPGVRDPEGTVTGEKWYLGTWEEQ